MAQAWNLNMPWSVSTNQPDHSTNKNNTNKNNGNGCNSNNNS